MQACLQQLGVTVGQPQTQQGGGFGLGGWGGLGGGGTQQSGANRQSFQQCLPASLRRFRARVTTPSQTLRQVLNPPQTNITTSAYTIGGVDQTSPTMGVVTTAQVTKGTFLSPAGGKEALVATSYAAKHSLARVLCKFDVFGCHSWLLQEEEETRGSDRLVFQKRVVVEARGLPPSRPSRLTRKLESHCIRPRRGRTLFPR